MTTAEKNYAFKGFKGEWQVVSESSMTFPTGNSRTAYTSTEILRTPTNCLFPYKNCNKNKKGYRNDLTTGIIPASLDGLPHRMWAKFVCKEPLGCAKIGTSGKYNNKQIPEVKGNFIATDTTSKILQYKIAAIGCLPGQGLDSLTHQCAACPEGYVSPFVGPYYDALKPNADPSPSTTPASCTACPIGKTLPKSKELPTFSGLELLECAYPLNGKTSDGDTKQLGCPHVGYNKLSEVFSVTQEIGEVVYLGTRFCGANRCNQYVTQPACAAGATDSIVTGNAFSYKSTTTGANSQNNKCRWSTVTRQCVAVLQSSLVVSEISSPPRKVRDRANLDYVRSLQRYANPLAAPIYQESLGPTPTVKVYPKEWQSKGNQDKNLAFEYMIKLEAVQYKRNVFIQAKCLDKFGCPGLRASVETRGCAAGSFGAAPNCTVCSANTYGLADAAPVALSEDIVCSKCPVGKSISALALPSQRASECACQNNWPMESPPVSLAMAGWCPHAVLRAKNVMPMQFQLPNRKKNPTNGITHTSFQIIQRAGTILRFTPLEKILEVQNYTYIPKPIPNGQNKNSGRPISLSSDGKRVAIGAPSNQDNNSAVRVFEQDYYSGEWKQIGHDIEGKNRTRLPIKHAEIIRYDQEPNCGDAPIPQVYSYQLKTLKMWAGDTSSTTTGSTQPQKQSSKSTCMPLSNNVDFEVQGSRSNRADDDPGINSQGGGASIPNSQAISTQVPGVLTIGSSCQDRVVYFHAEADDCYGKHAIWTVTIRPQTITADVGSVVTQTTDAGTATGKLINILTGVGMSTIVIKKDPTGFAFDRNGGDLVVTGKSIPVTHPSTTYPVLSGNIFDATEENSAGCDVTIEVTEEEVTKCIEGRVARNSTVSSKSFIPVLGSYDIRVNTTIYARCASEFRVGSLGAERVKKEILNAFLAQSNTCIGSGAACLVDETESTDGVNGISVVFDDYMNQTVR